MTFEASKQEGDPCICGNKETWHPECYQKANRAKSQEEIDKAFNAGIEEGKHQGMERAAELLEKAAANEPAFCDPDGIERKNYRYIAEAIRAEIKGEV